MSYIKHLIECNCILPQFRDLEPPIFHRFIVFSVFDKNNKIIKKITKCPNCGLIHQVFDIEKSKILTSEKGDLTFDEDEVKLSFPDKLLKVINKYSPPLHILEHIEYILKNKLWGDSLILVSNSKNDIKNGKILIINGPNEFQLKSFEEKTFIE